MNDTLMTDHLIRRYPWLGPWAIGVVAVFVLAVLVGLVQMAVPSAPGQSDVETPVDRVLVVLLAAVWVFGLLLSVVTALLIVRERAHAVDWPGTLIIAVFIPFVGAAFLLLGATNRARVHPSARPRAEWDIPLRSVPYLVVHHPWVRAGAMGTFAALFALAIAGLTAPGLFTRDPEPVWLQALALSLFVLGPATMVGATFHLLRRRAHIVDSHLTLAFTWLVPIFGVAVMIGWPGWQRLMRRWVS